MKQLTEVKVIDILDNYPALTAEDNFASFVVKGQTEKRLKEATRREMLNQKTTDTFRKLVILNQGTKEELQMARNIGLEIRNKVLETGFSERITQTDEKRFVRFLGDMSYAAVKELLATAYARNRRALPTIQYDKLLLEKLEETGQSLTLEYLMTINEKEFEKRKKQNKKQAG